MQQYQQTPVTRTTKSNIVQPAAPTMTEQQLVALVQRLNSITEYQSRQIRRLENDIIVLKEHVSRNNK